MYDHTVLLNDTRPIGMFDSGFGGLTVLAQIRKALPQENIIYYGDNARAPYGNRPQDEIISFNHEIVEFMLEKNVKAIIMACNTSTSLSLAYNKEHFPVPFINLIEHGIDPINTLSKTRTIAVIATEGTIRSKSFNEAIRTKFDDITVMGIACPQFVPLIENGEIYEEKTRRIAQQYLAPAFEHRADVVILGCTHYPFLRPVLEDIAPSGVTFLDPAVEAAKYTLEYLQENGLLSKSTAPGRYEYYTSGDPVKFKEIGERYLGFPLEHVFGHSFAENRVGEVCLH